MMKIAMAALFGGAGVLVLGCGLVLAAEAVPVAAQPGIVPDWGAQLQGYMRTAIDGVIAIGLALGLAWLKHKTGLDIEIKNQATVQTATANAAGLLIQQGVAIGAQVGGEAMAAGVQYVQDNAADALEHFGLTPEDIETKIRAKLGLVAASVGLAR